MKGCDEIITKYACKTLECLYAFLDTNKSNYVHEEWLLAIAALFSATNQSDCFIQIFDPGTFNKLVTVHVHAGLTSEDDGVISATCLLIGNLFYF